MKVLIDTNILIDYFGRREKFYHEAVKLKAAAFFGDIDIWATSNSFTDVFYILHKEHPSHVIQDMFLAAKNHINVCSVTQDDIFNTAQEKWSDFEDCLIYTCAKKIRVDYLLTRDIDGFLRCDIPCLTPSDFFSVFEEQTGISYEDTSLQPA